jgi:hypothetical protein|tara:strand:+ start:793 stop:1413 length:621 start_codon:yes stop_codon:yes gene_type:complete
MKITQKQLKQIIREEIQQEGFLDSIGDFIKGTNKEYSAFLKKYDAAMKKRSKGIKDRFDAAERGDKQPFFDMIEMLTKLGEENLRFDPKKLSSSQKTHQASISKNIESRIQSAADDIAEIDQNAAEEAERKAEELRQKRKAEFANRPMVGVLTRAEKEAARKSRKASEREYNKKYAMRTRDAFSESKLTKEDVKQIIREEIKNFKR